MEPKLGQLFLSPEELDILLGGARPSHYLEEDFGRGEHSWVHSHPHNLPEKVHLGLWMEDGDSFLRGHPLLASDGTACLLFFGFNS